ncbi:ArsR family transcriptional regulator [Streptomyces sp. NPDC051940]|uniref:ArsR family transcriptional regulator n=1 Tax=Streptomyces sp. NPDC051940 TaxID=3155675 RepID=UPI00341F66A2
MLRIHFTDADLVRTKVAATSDPLWEVVCSLHRLQARRGRWAFAGWHRDSRERLRERGLERVLRRMLVPLVPYAAYFPDFLTPPEAGEGIAGGLEALLDVPQTRVEAELRTLATVRAVPPELRRIAGREGRRELTRAIRGYHDAVIAPYEDRVLAQVEADRAARARTWLDGGMDALLATLSPWLVWDPPVLSIPRYPAVQDLHLGGRGLLLVPVYFSWGNPVTLADPGLTPVLTYPVLSEQDPAGLPGDLGSGAALSALLGGTRAEVLRTASAGATTGELARAAGVSASAASQHTGALRNAGLLISRRHGQRVLHSLTPAGAALLRASGARVRTSAIEV